MKLYRINAEELTISGKVFKEGDLILFNEKTESFIAGDHQPCPIHQFFCERPGWTPITLSDAMANRWILSDEDYREPEDRSPEGSILNEAFDFRSGT